MSAAILPPDFVKTVENALPAVVAPPKITPPTFKKMVAPSETVAEAMQICAGVTVPAKTAGGAAEAGPAYGCLGEYPNPTWMYAKIGTSGTMSFNVSISSGADVDFAIWGPFASTATVSQLTAAKLKACDYSGANGGTAALGTVTAGEYYMILITNFAATTGNLSLTVAGSSTATIECPSPGGISSTVKYWAKANKGTSSSVNAAQVATWSDQTPTGWHATQATAAARPTFVENAINFNPALNFASASSQYLNLAGISGFPSGNKSFFAVTVPTTLNGAGTNGIIGAGATLQEIQFGYQNAKINAYEGNGATTYNAVSTNTYLAGNAYLASSIRNGTNISLFNSGAADGTATGNVSVTANRLTIGAHNASGTVKNYWNGQIAEIVMFGAAVTEPERFKIETYLGLKYGITLAHDYVDYNGTTIFSANGGAATDFDAHIFGIGRSDRQALHQRQSKSDNSFLTIGLTTIATTNLLNSNNLNNETHLIMGDNNVAAGAAAMPNNATCPSPVGMTGLFSRTWKAEETGGAVGATLLRVATANLTGLATNQPMYLVVADDNTLTTNVKYILMTTNGSNQEVTYDFNGTKYFSFAGGLATETVCTGYHSVRWATQGWTAGALTKTVTLNNGLTMTTTVADPQNVLRSGYPKLYQGLPAAYISTNSDSKSITWTSDFNQIVASCNFSVYDIDNVGTLSEHIDVKGYKGATVVNPVLSRAASSSVLVNGTVSTGQINNIESYSPFAKVNVSFNEPIDKVVITYKNNKNTLYPRGAMMLLSDFAIFCPAPVANVDKIMLSKVAPSGNINRGDTINYTFQFNNADCAAKTVNFTDVLPTGFTWSPNSLISPLNGTTNNYGGTNTISIANMTVPTGLSTFTLSAFAGAAAGTYNNQASFVVNGTTYLSDDPNQVGTSNSTPITLIAAPTTAPLTMTKAISATSVLNNGILTFTYTFNNTGGTAIVTDFTDEIQPDTVRYKAGSLTYGSGMTGTANAYDNVSSLYINNLSIPTGTSTMTVQAEMNGCEVGDYQNVAMVIPTAASGFREKEVSSNAIGWTVTQPSSFQYAYNCNGSTVQGNFVANGATGQIGAIRLAINVLNTGTADFTVTGTGFTGSLTTTLFANTTDVLIPITYTGAGSDGSRMLTISSPNGMGACTANLNIGAVCKAAGGRIGN
jgi:large repetitive protein